MLKMSLKGDTILKREYVACALCGQDDTEVKFVIEPANLKLSTVWVDNVQHQVNNTETIVICKNCGLVYVNPRLAADVEVATYSPEQEQKYFENTRDLRKAAYHRLMRQLPLWLDTTAQTLLDIGCGDGVLLEVARQMGIASVGSEIRETLITLVRERVGKDAIVSADLAQLPENYYDVITLINVLEHVPHPDEMLRMCARLLKPEGVVVAHVPNLAGLPAKWSGAGWRHLEPLEHFYYFTPQTMKALMRQAGFEPMARFNLIITTGVRANLQNLLGKMGIYLDNGLGLVARLQSSMIVKSGYE